MFVLPLSLTKSAWSCISSELVNETPNSHVETNFHDLLAWQSQQMFGNRVFMDKLSYFCWYLRGKMLVELLRMMYIGFMNRILVRMVFYKSVAVPQTYTSKHSCPQSYSWTLNVMHFSEAFLASNWSKTTLTGGRYGLVLVTGSTRSRYMGWSRCSILLCVGYGINCTVCGELGIATSF